MNRYELLDAAPLAVAGRVIGDDRQLFADGIDSPGYESHLAGVSFDLPDVRGPQVRQFRVETLAGELDAGVFVARWLGPDRPTIVYHHGHRERPFAMGRFASNSFKRLFLDADEPLDVNLIAVRAPLHTLGLRSYLNRVVDLSTFVAMLAVSVELVERIVSQVADGAGRTVVAGLSLGGFVTNLHRTFHGTADEYVPMLAGARLSDVFLGGAYRYVTARRARRHPAALRSTLDFDEAFRRAEGAVWPLLARSDAIVRYESQRPTYEDRPVEVVQNGHLTAAMATEPLRHHVLAALA